MSDHLDPQDARPDPWSSEPQIIFIDPRTASVQFLTDPATGQLCAADVIDGNGELVVHLDMPEDAEDAVFLMSA